MKPTTIIYGLCCILVLCTVSAGKVDYIIQPTCESDSMYPSVRCGDRFVVNTHTKNDNLTIGDIYCYRGNTIYWGITWDTHICHRLTDTDDEYAYFLGDRGVPFCLEGTDWCGDPPVEHKFIAYHVIEVIPKNSTRNIWYYTQPAPRGHVEEADKTPVDTRIRKCWKNCSRRDNPARKGKI